jgi:hypothetical protein
VSRTRCSAQAMRRRAGTQRLHGARWDGPRLCSAPQERCAASGARERSVARMLSSSSLRAKRSNPESFRRGILDCFVASLLAMTAYEAASPSSSAHFNPQTHLRILAAYLPELCLISPPSKPRGCREGRVLTSHPRSAARIVAQRDRTAAYRWCQSLGLPCAVVGRLMPCSPGSRVRSGLPHSSEIHRHRAG